MPLTLAAFVARRRASGLTERAAQSHFIDLCDARGVPRPAAVDQTDGRCDAAVRALNHARAAAAR